MLILKEACTSKSICRGAGTVPESWGGGKLSVEGDTQGSGRLGQPVDRTDAQRIVTAAWRLLAGVRMEVEML